MKMNMKIAMSVRSTPEMIEKAMQEFVKNKDDLHDSDNEYLHVIIACGEDNCSGASYKDLLSFNSVMKNMTNDFRTACIQYECKSDEVLREDLFKITLSCQKNILSEASGQSITLDDDQINVAKGEIDYGIFKVASARNIDRKLKEVFDWFRDPTPIQDHARTTSVGYDLNNSQLELKTDKFGIKKKGNRFVVISLCVP